jgi:hypothetical protein
MRSETDLAAVRTALTALSIGLAVTSFYLIICFVRGLRMDLALKRDGMLTYARITEVKEGHGGKNMPEHWLRLNFEFQDASGRVRRDEIVENYQPGDRKWKAGDMAKVRYHPEEPSIYRWIGDKES